MGCAAPNPLHWEDLRTRPSEMVLRRKGVKEAALGKAFEITFLDAAYLVDPHRETITELFPEPNRPLSEAFQILLIRYLVAEYGGPADGRDVSEKDLPGGVTFFQGPHALHVSPITKRFGDDPTAFLELGRAFGGEVRSYGDGSLRFLPFPEIPVTYVLWRADEEFPASVSVLFDASITRWFELDMVFTLVMVLTERICEDSDGKATTEGRSVLKNAPSPRPPSP
ncbi:MAG: DUF3786 domain-containing protein [Thermodesulfobacteriota bacterium]